MDAFYCLLSCKDTNLKAIHNSIINDLLDVVIVFYLAKIRI